MALPPDDVAALYDEWAADYHAAHANWDEAITQHGRALRDVLACCGVAPPARVLDCTAGIGTQALGLADAGYEVSASDLSPVQIRRLQHEADARGLMIDAAVADLLQLTRTLPRSATWSRFDVVLSANSLTHLGSIAELTVAFTEMAGVCRRGGCVVVTNRDYDALVDARPTSTPVQRSLDDDGTERLSFQLWDWADDGCSYRMEDVLVVRPAAGAEWTARSRVTTLYPWRRADVDAAAAAAGLREPTWHDEHWQPIATYRVAGP
jgi:SAM-dependent methyltransferase